MRVMSNVQRTCTEFKASNMNLKKKKNLSLAAMQIDQGSSRSAVGSDDVTDESVSQVDIRWSSEEDEV